MLVINRSKAAQWRSAAGLAAALLFALSGAGCTEPGAGEGAGGTAAAQDEKAEGAAREPRDAQRAPAEAADPAHALRFNDKPLFREGRHPIAEVIEPAQIRGAVQSAPLYRTEFLSPIYTVDKIYRSMMGPAATERALLFEVDERELIWITGYSSRVTGPEGREARAPEFMCHSNLDTVKSQVYQRFFPTELGPRSMRLFSLDQGTLEVEFPTGFGVPAFSDQNFKVTTQILNHNVVGEPFDIRQRVAIDFVRNRDLEKPLRPLMMRPVFNLVLLEGQDGHFGVEGSHGDDGEFGPGCSVALDVGHPWGLMDDDFGRKFSNFWVVPPGTHEYHTRVTLQLQLPYDTFIHYASAHLHPFAESVELYDLTAGESVLKLHARPAPEGIGLAEVESTSSREGLRLYHDHEYDLVTVYANDSGVDQDAMASLFLYLQVRDLVFESDPEKPPYGRWYKLPPPRLGSRPS